MGSASPTARLGSWAASAVGLRPKLRDQVRLGEDVAWFDEYFAIQRLDPGTVAIVEPRYHQENVNYLIEGRDAALLFDSGPGLRDLVPVVERLTRLPVTATCSHLHYDHVGNLGRFADVRLLDLPAYRRLCTDGVLVPTRRLHGGFLEGIRRPAVRVAGWYPAGEVIDLGARRLRVLHLPGHSLDGMALHDLDRNLLFVGDFIYPGGAYAFTPGADLGDYVRSAAAVLAAIDDDTLVLAAHTGRPARTTVPVMRRGDVEALLAGLRAVRDGTARGSGVFPRRYPVTSSMNIYAGFRRHR
jgi:hydroxyacylglutathione hydrolase